jgi:hypothetical protein
LIFRQGRCGKNGIKRHPLAMARHLPEPEPAPVFCHRPSIAVIKQMAAKISNQHASNFFLEPRLTDRKKSAFD